MKSIKTKIITLVLSFTIASSLVIGSFSMINSRKAVEQDSIEILNLLCENKVNNLNNLLRAIEESVNTLTQYAYGQISNYDQLIADEAIRQQYLDQLLDISINAVDNTRGASTVYIRLNPEFAGPTSGFFYSDNTFDKSYVALPPTNLDSYAKDDREHVGWYYEAVTNKKPTWIAPYYNKNIEREIISYVIPYYYQNQFIGVVGMDIDFKEIKEAVSETKSYDSGYAFLVDNNANILYHQDIMTGTSLVDYNDGEFNNMAELIQTTDAMDIPDTLVEYVYEGIPKKSTFRILVNDMRFVLAVPKHEIDELANNLLYQISTLMLFIVAIVTILTFIFAKRFTKPLLELTEVSKKMANGDLNVKIEHKSKDELGILAESFQQTIVHLDRYFSSIKSLAYLDALTGVKNKTAYLEEILEIDKSIMMNEINFSVFVFDINRLKHINDNYGHSSGDTLIINSCNLLCDVFENQTLYRIGGDEFVVIVRDVDHHTCSKYIDSMKRAINTFNQKDSSKIDISIAHGYAIFDAILDERFYDVFERADKKMYENKAQTKNI